MSTISKFAWLDVSDNGTANLKAFGDRLSEQEIADFESSFGKIARISSMYWDLRNLQIELDELKSAKQNAIQDFRAQRSLVYYEGHRAAFFLSQIERKLTSFLSVASVFRDRLNKAVSNQEIDGIEIESYESVRKAIYDSDFIYRLLYNLRNYSCHQRSPISTMPLTARRENEGFVFDLRLTICPKDLLASDKIQPRVRREIVDTNLNEMEVISSCEAYLLHHRKIFCAVVAPLRSHFHKLYDFVNQTRAEHSPSAHSLLVISHVTPEQVAKIKKANFRLSHFPYRDVEALLKILDDPEGQA